MEYHVVPGEGHAWVFWVDGEIAALVMGGLEVTKADLLEVAHARYAAWREGQ